MGQESQNHFRARAEQEVPAVGDQSWHPRGGRVVCPKRGFVAMNGSPAQGIPSIASPILGAGASEVAEVIDSLERITLAEESAPNLNAEQQRALDLVLEGKNIFVTGVGGTGKSVLLREMRRRLELEGKVVGIAAPTGLAAEAINGTTIHSVAGFGLPKTVNNLGIASQLKTSVIKSYDVLMIDEVSMVAGEFFDRVSEHMSAVRQNGRPFGGMQIVLFGDFLQLGPMDNTKKRGKSGFCPALILNRGYAFESWTWRDLKLQLPRTNNAGAPSFSDGKWWWDLGYPEHPGFKLRQGAGRVQVIACDAAVE